MQQQLLAVWNDLTVPERLALTAIAKVGGLHPSKVTPACAGLTRRALIEPCDPDGPSAGWYGVTPQGLAVYRAWRADRGDA